MKSTFVQTPDGKYRVRYYRERATGHYLAVFPDNVCGDGSVECLATAYPDVPNSWVSTSESRDFLRNRCRRVAREEVPETLRRRAESVE